MSVTKKKKKYEVEPIPLEEERDSLSQPGAAREAQNLLSLYEKNSKTTHRYWAARCIS